MRLSLTVWCITVLSIEPCRYNSFNYTLLAHKRIPAHIHKSAPLGIHVPEYTNLNETETTHHNAFTQRFLNHDCHDFGMIAMIPSPHVGANRQPPLPRHSRGACPVPDTGAGIRGEGKGNITAIISPSWQSWFKNRHSREGGRFLAPLGMTEAREGGMCEGKGGTVPFACVRGRERAKRCSQGMKGGKSRTSFKIMPISVHKRITET